MTFFSFLSVCMFCMLYVVWCQNFKPILNQRRRPNPTDIVMPRSFTARSVLESFNRADDIIAERRSTLTSRGNISGLIHRTISSDRHLLFRASIPRTQRSENLQEKFEEATRALFTEFNLTPKQIMTGLPKTDLKTVLPGNEAQECKAQFNFSSCRKDDRYRTFDGTCNNLRHPSWGMSAACFERLVEPDYGDGVADIRLSSSGNPLPDPRRLSLEFHSDFDSPTDDVTHFYMMWGQFLTHDISFTPDATGVNNEELHCCPVNANDSPNCNPVILQRNDPFFSKFNIFCLSHVRSAKCSTCSLGPRQQTNQVTSYLDGSHIYGLNREQSNGLRTNDGTFRVTNSREAGDLLPKSSKPKEDKCSFQDPILKCFEAGDQRVNQHPALTSLHTIFMREHNRLVRRLSEINPGWNEERLFQEARKIVGAELQMVAYNEYLPLTLGPENMKWYDLNVRPNNQYTQYDETIQATLLNEFSVGAFRFGHSMINYFFRETGGTGGHYMRDIYFYPFGLYTGQIERIIEGLSVSPAQTFDRYMVPDVSNHLFQRRGNETGLDLTSIDIKRGRDHGIPGYTTLVKYCGGPVITSWEDVDRLLRRGMRERLESLYERVEDIDLFTGGLAEIPEQGAVIGPTFTCIIGIQFYHLKFGDRFYFEHEGQTGSFTPNQLRELKKVSLGKIVCDNTRIQELPEKVFLFEGDGNRMENCNSKQSMNLNAWKV